MLKSLLAARPSQCAVHNRCAWRSKEKRHSLLHSYTGSLYARYTNAITLRHVRPMKILVGGGKGMFLKPCTVILYGLLGSNALRV